MWIPKGKRERSSMAQRGKSAAEEEEKDRDVRRMFKILREVWLNISITNGHLLFVMGALIL